MGATPSKEELFAESRCSSKMVAHKLIFKGDLRTAH